MNNYYKLLNISYDADTDEIKAAFRKLAKKFHPDLNSFSSNSSFRELFRAYKILSTNNLRESYDKHLKSKNIIKRKDYTKIAKSRIIYSSSLKNLGMRGLVSKVRKERLKTLGYDIAICLNKKEASSDITINIPLPAKEICSYCFSRESVCSICDGRGYILTTKEIEIFLDRHSIADKIFHIDLSKRRFPNEKSYFTLKSIRLLIKTSH